jgi:hypothetical protein
VILTPALRFVVELPDLEAHECSGEHTVGKPSSASQDAEDTDALVVELHPFIHDVLSNGAQVLELYSAEVDVSCWSIILVLVPGNSAGVRLPGARE